jgi:hypothetical protein
MIFKAPLNGTEMLGDPGIFIAAGNRIKAAGVGLRGGPASISITLDAGVTVKQVLLYWEGYNETATGDDQITAGVNSITGVLIGGPTLFWPGNWSSSYRADITSYGLVGPGANSVAIGGMDFNKNNGAGIVVIYDDGSANEVAGIKDGNDLAYWDFVPSLDTTEWVTFSLVASTDSRTGKLILMASSAEARPSVVEVDCGSGVTRLIDVFDDVDGAKWDTATRSITIPAGCTSIRVRCLSERDASSVLPNTNPVSICWLFGGLEVPVDEEGDSCTPGYWKNVRMHGCEWAAAGYSPTDDFDTVFGTDWFSPDKTLRQALEAKNSEGGGCGRTARHGTAALLNAANPDVNYPMTVAEVIAAVQSCDADMMAGYNEDLPCYLNNCKDNY